MNPIRTYDAGPAIVASLISNAHGGKAKPTDFMPYHKEEEKSASLDEFVQALGSVRIGKR